MPRTPPRRHLVLHHNRSACGLRNPRLRTRDPEEVTCLGCRKSVQMHDLMIRQQPEHRP